MHWSFKTVYQLLPPSCRHPLAPSRVYKIKPCKGTNPGMVEKAKIDTIPSATPNQRSE